MNFTLSMKKITLFAVLTLISWSMMANNQIANFKFPFESEMKKIDSLINIGQPKSALKLLLPFKEAAIAEKHTGYYVLSVTKEMTLNKTLTDNNSDVDQWVFLQNEIATTRLKEALPFLHLTLAYNLKNKYNYYRSDNTNHNDSSADWNDWSNENLVQKMNENLLLAHAYTSHHSKKNLFLTYNETLAPLVENYKDADVQYTIEQMVLLQILNVVDGISLPKDIDYQSPLTEKTLAPLDSFVKIDFKTMQDPYNHYFILHMYQELIGCIGNDETDKLIVLDLKRLEFAKQFDLSNDNKIWISSLETLLAKQDNHAFSNLIVAEIAEHYQTSKPITALEICNKALLKHPQFKFNDRLENIVTAIKKIHISLETETIYQPNKPMLAKVDYKNLSKVYVEVLKLDYLKYIQYYSKNQSYLNDIDKQKEFSKSVATYEIDLPMFSDYRTHSAEIPLNPLPKGQYIFLLRNDKKEKGDKDSFVRSGVIHVTEMVVIIQEKSISRYALNGLTGKPIANAPYTIYKKSYDYKANDYEVTITKMVSEKTDGNGQLNLEYLKNNKGSNSHIIAFEQDDYYFEINAYELNEYGRNTPDAVQNIQIFTDRNIYRPGQTVYFKGILYDETQKKIIANEKIEIVLKDNNHQKQGELVLTTNEYGSVAGNFVLPVGGINTGQFWIETLWKGKSYSGKYFSVEEYKRPKYSATINPPTVAYKLNDLVQIEGNAKAYAGYPIQGAKVDYTVSRNVKPKHYWWYYRGMPQDNSDPVVIINGATKTDEMGSFYIDFKALPDESVNQTENPYFNYTIAASITDINGEVHTAEYVMTLAYTDLELNLSGSLNYKEGEAIKLNIGASNLQGKPLPIKGYLQIEKLIENSEPKRPKLWEKADTTNMTQAEFKKLFPDYEYPNLAPKYQLIEKANLDNYSQTEWSSKAINEQGQYKATLFSKDGNGTMISESYVFEINPGKKGKYSQPKVLATNILNPKDFEPNDKAQILISSGTTAEITVVAKSLRGEILRQTFTLCKESKLIEIPITEADRGNIEVHTYTTNNYRFYQEGMTIAIPYNNKELTYTVKSIRDKTEPGAKEKWILTIKGHEGSKIIAEHLANMYDQSLDALVSSNQFNFWPYQNFAQYLKFENDFTLTYSESFNFNDRVSSFNALRESHLFYPSDQMFGMGHGLIYGNAVDGSALSVSKGASRSLGREDDGVADKSFKSESEDKPKTQKSDVAPPIRTNFNETAFFMPQMLTNADGDLVLEFTMPESLTQWKLMVLGHTPDLKIGTYTQSITASKKMMVQPNFPRFLREKDTISIAAKIVNTTHKEFATSVQLLLTDASTGEKLDWLISGNNMLVMVASNGSRSVSFDIAVPNFTGIVDIAIMSQAGNYTDGELHTIPVLTNRKLMTESMPITVNEKGTQNLVFQSLKDNKSTTLTNHSFTLELSSNPAWYAVQSLPYLVEFPHECAEQTFSRLYADLVANHIAKNNPKILPMIKQWENAAKTDSSILLSKLKTNQSLKYTVIEETPWLFEANKETEQKQKLALLFDAKRIDQNKKAGFERLKELQSENGGWSWFAGMNTNVYITQTIVIGFGKLKKMGVDISEYNDMLNRAMQFLDADAQRMYDYYLNQKDKGYRYEPSNLQYLYCKSYFPKIGMAVNNKVVAYFVTNTENQWVNAGLMQKAQLVTALKVLKPESKIPELIIKSLTENAQNSKEMGMYWKQNNGGYYWYQSSIETQAAIIEAYSSTQANPAMIMQQQIWLLRQKQTQNWKTTRATSDACFALLMKGNDWLNSPLQIEAKVDNITVSTANGQPGTGYIKRQIADTLINPQTANIQVTASSNNFGYGAAYWQYFENLDKIKKTASGIVIDKKIYKIVNTPKGEKKIALGVNDSLQIGDRIEVSMNISTDRNLEYVHIKDLRGSGTEPVDVLSGYKWQGGAGFYQTTLDASTNFFIDYLSKGNYQFNYQLTLQQAGVFNCGLATAQCMYAPEYVGNSKTTILKVVK